MFILFTIAILYPKEIICQVILDFHKKTLYCLVVDFTIKEITNYEELHKK